MADQDPGPVFPEITRLNSVAIELHEMFGALKEAGFRHKDALYIISVAVSEGVMLPIYINRNEDSDEVDEDEDEIDDDEDFDDEDDQFDLG
jgi:hypothetical protein